MDYIYILQCVFLVGVLILIWYKYTSNRNSENNNTRENAVQTTIVTQRQNTSEKESQTEKPKYPSLTIPTAKVYGTKKNSRLQRDFLSTAPGKIRNRGNNPVSEAVRENIKLIENDLKVKESSLLDEMQGYLTEGEVDKITKSSRKDQAHYFAAIIEEYEDSNFISVLDILNKSSFGHISSELKKSYEKHLSTQTPNTSCVICRIQSEVNIKSLRCELIKEDLLTKNLKDMINDCKTSKGHQNYLWQELFFHLKSLQPKQNIAEKFISIFKDTNHRSISSSLSMHGLSCYDCTCQRKPSIETDYFRATSSLTVSDESNTSSIPIHREPHWYQDAVHSSSSEEGAKPASTTLQRPTENSDASTTSLDSYSRLRPVRMSKFSSTRNGIYHPQRRPVKRAMNPENRQRTESAELPSISGSDDGTSDTMLKTPFGTKECLRKRQFVDAFLVRPFISE